MYEKFLLTMIRIAHRCQRIYMGWGDNTSANGQYTFEATIHKLSVFEIYPIQLSTSEIYEVRLI